MKRKLLWLGMAVVVIAALSVPALGGTITLNAPDIEIEEVGSTTVTVRVTGGADYGSPNGFTVQWMSVLDDWSGEWPQADLSQAVFTGHGIAGSPFVLLPDGEVDIVVGREDGRQTVTYVPDSALAALQPGTQYAFRVFANGLAEAYDQSAYSGTVLATTDQGDSERGRSDEPVFAQSQEQDDSRRGKGYWKNHEEWPVVDGEDYSDFFGTGKSWNQILQTPPKKGDTYYMLAHKYIAAKLNTLAGYEPPQEVADAITAAEEYFAAAEPGVKANTEQGKANLALAAILASWGAVEDDPGELQAEEAGNQAQGGPPEGKQGPPEGTGKPDGAGKPEGAGKGKGGN